MGLFIESQSAWLERLYRLIAEGENTQALDEIWRRYPEVVRPPNQELNLVRLVQGASLNVEN